MTSINISDELERFRERLLDLSNRNQLLNYRASQQRTLQIMQPAVGTMFQRLVMDRDGYRFAPRESSPIAMDDPKAVRQTSLDLLHTDRTDRQLQQVSTTMLRTAKSAIEETGVNYLYLALGWLEWTEASDSQRRMSAPLILLPVALERVFVSQQDRYEVSVHYTGEEIQPNLCLTRRFQRDFGIDLPAIMDENGRVESPDRYFLAVADRIRGQADWQIHEQALLGFFQFTKLFMYMDLAPENWTGEHAPENNSLIRSVIEGAEQLTQSTEIFAPDYDIDDNPAAERIRLVKDADSSQHSALCDIASGKNLVVEGPPGTGKSQTITNAIADAMYRGQSVLFVSEKLAALEVVKNNLSDVGLGEFCLELHSHAANPQRAMQEIRDRLNRGPHPLAEEADATRQRVTARRNRITSLLKSMETPLGPQRRPAYEVLWRVAELRSRHLAPRSLPLPQNVTADQFDEACTALHELSAHISELGALDESPWHGLAAERLLPSQIDIIVRSLADARELSREIHNATIKLADELGGEPPCWLQFALAPISDELTSDWPAESFESICRWAAHLLSPQAEMVERLIAAVQAANEKTRAAGVVLERSATDELCASATAAQRLLSVATPLQTSPLRHAKVESIIALAHETTGAWQVSLGCLKRIKKTAVTLQELGFGPIATLNEYERATNTYLLMFHPFVMDGVPDPVFFKHSTSMLIARARAELEQASGAIESVADFVERSRLPEPNTLKDLIEILEEHGKSAFAWLEPKYRRAQKLIREFTRPAAHTLDFRGQLQMLRAIVAGGWTGFSEEGRLRKKLGGWFRGDKTDWDELEQMVRWCERARRQGLDHPACVARCEAVDNAPRLTNRELLDPVSRLKQRWPNTQLAPTLSRHSLWSQPLTDGIEQVEQLVEAARVLRESGARFVPHDCVGDLLRSARLVAESEQSLRDLESTDFSERFSDVFDGVRTNLQHASEARRLIETLRKADLDDDIIRRMLDRGERGGSLSDTPDDAQTIGAKEFLHLLKSTANAARRWQDAIKPFSALGDQPQPWLTLPGPAADPAHYARLSQADDSCESLGAWADCCRAIVRCNELGLGDFVADLLEDSSDRLRAVELYDLTLHEQLAETFLIESGLLRDGTRQAIETAREQYRQLDEELIERQPWEIISKLCSLQAPSGNSKGRLDEFTEMSLVRHELNKQNGHVRIRDLMRRAGETMLTLKPCIMMSPLSIAQFLEPGAVQFDLVVMDEASQIKPEDAMGALLRAKQVVVVGDPKQLPPTSFFDRIGDEDEVAAEDATLLTDNESILEVAMKTFPVRRRLRWHYRSQHESLIEFSNDQFYDGELVIFPSPLADRAQLGIQCELVRNGIFEKGCNLPEAEVVARAIIDHAMRHPDESLGVAAFNASQARAIQDCLESLTLHNRSARRAVHQLETGPRPLFVKNLESVQGDERDVILISYTYGPTRLSTGRVSNRFGPINGPHGWRRLNVLVTRARKRVKVFTSLNPKDISGGPERSRGVNAMRDYLEYAQLGVLPPRQSPLRFHSPSPMETALLRTIERMGLRAVPRVGVEQYCIDLGVLAPGRDSQFLLGIEWDGRSYHNAKSTRDRDRLKEQVLAERGWTLHRVWSTDWFLNREAAEQRLQAAVQQQLSLWRATG